MNDLSRAAKGYILGTILLGTLLSAFWLTQFAVEEVWVLLLAAGLASLLQFQSVFGATARSSYSLSWIVYCFALVALGPSAALIVIVVAHVVEWMTDPERLKWFVQLFNMGTFAVAVTISGLLLGIGRATFAGGSAGWLLMTLAGLAAFTLVNHLMVGLVIWLARGQTLTESGVLGTFTLMLDFALLCLGFIAALIWELNSVAVVLVAFVAYLLYEALKVPALERKAEMDAKTQLFNANYFNRALERELARAIRFGRPLAVVMADLDLLRRINNSYGHLAGDVVLQGVAQTLQEAAGDYDVVSRFGGEEFAILLPETTASDALARTEKVRREIAAATFHVGTSVEPIHATMSFGVAAVHGDDVTAEQLIQNADKALYQAKRQGRNCVAVFGAAGDPPAPAPAAEGEATGESAGEGARTVGAEEKQGEEGAGPEETAGKGGPDVRGAQSAGDVEVGSPPESRLFPPWAVSALITALVLTSALLGIFSVRNAPAVTDWPGLVLFAALALLVEYLAVEIYARDTTVSTSAALLISGAFLFGPTGSVVLGPIIALASYFSQNQRPRALVFNAGNHTFAGLLVAGTVQLTAPFVDSWTLPRLLIGGALAGAIVFLATTYLLTGVMVLSNSGRFYQLWAERFRWLAIYYLVLGLVAAGLVFSYEAAGAVGILILVAPLFMLRYSQKQYLDHTTKMVVRLREANQELLQQADEIARLNEDLLLTLARSVDLRDPDVMEHSKHVARYAVCVAEEMNLPEAHLEKIRKAGLLHDIGKLGVPERILFKPDRLTEAEYETVKRHVDIGAELIKGCHSLHGLVPMVHHHHEKYDGTGYPDGLAGEEIPLEARILGLADAVEAMASDRPYRKAMSPTEIVEEILRCAGTHFDPEVAQAFVRVVRERGDTIIVNSARAALQRESAGASLYLPRG